MDFAPMPRRETGALSQLARKASAGVDRIEAMREPHAAFWDEWNLAALDTSGPLWIALGDSSSQGIGVSDPMQSWVPLILERLRSKSGEPWRVINLSITGGQYSDIIEHQLPRIEQLQSAGHTPALCTLIAGANNLMSPASWRGANGELKHILEAMPDPAVVARVGISSPLNSLMARRFTGTIERISQDRGFQNFWPWDWPSRDGMAEDKFHPNAAGYGYMVDIIWEPMRAALDL